MMLSLSWAVILPQSLYSFSVWDRQGRATKTGKIFWHRVISSFNYDESECSCNASDFKAKSSNSTSLTNVCCISSFSLCAPQRKRVKASFPVNSTHDVVVSDVTLRNVTYRWYYPVIGVFTESSYSRPRSCLHHQHKSNASRVI